MRLRLMRGGAVAQAFEVVAEGVHQRGVLRKQQRQSQKQAHPGAGKHERVSTMQQMGDRCGETGANLKRV